MPLRPHFKAEEPRKQWKLVMRKLIYSLLIGIVFAGCGEDNMVEEQAVMPVVSLAALS